MRIYYMSKSCLQVHLNNLFHTTQGSDKFTIRYVFGPKGASKAEIILLQELDFEKQNIYSITVLAIVRIFVPNVCIRRTLVF